MTKQTIIIILFSLIAFRCTNTKKPDGVNKLQHLYIAHINKAISHLDSLNSSKSASKMKQHYLTSRKAFKKAEPILSFADKENYMFLNQSPFLKIHEEDATDIKIMEASGFQVLEELIFADSVNIKEIKRHTSLTLNRLKLLKSYSTVINYKPYHIIFMLKQSVLQIALAGITGFDSPVLGNSLQESSYVYTSHIDYLNCFIEEFTDKSLLNEYIQEVKNSIQFLNKDFDDFDRYTFIKKHTHNQLKLLNSIANDWNVEYPFTLAINNNVESLFSDSTFNLDFFSDYHHSFSIEKAKLGERLFYDNSLSSNGKFSCVTCHLPDLAFTDGLKKSKGQTRNSPTLTYAAYQQAYFHDGRAGSLEGQIVAVVNNKTEFHSNLEILRKSVGKNADYKKEFQRMYKDGVTDFNIRNAIADYIRTLAPFNSKFDKNINNIENNLTQSEINGFNLFTGKAQCATCHFAPLFNGTLPPYFTVSELEMIGTPINKDTLNAKIDDDLGRYHLFNVEERKHFFKTPTIRNIAKTAPYMHNGVYETLEEVMDFYNKGGGHGLGINIKSQTLPTEPLNLTEDEISDLINFMHTLSDDNNY